MERDDKILYLCNGKMPCHLRKDGKENEYCRREVNGIPGCYHTTDKSYAIDPKLPFVNHGPFTMQEK